MLTCIYIYIREKWVDTGHYEFLFRFESKFVVSITLTIYLLWTSTKNLLIFRGNRKMATTEIKTNTTIIPTNQPFISSWYATDLSRWEDTGAQILDDRDLVIQNKAYRRLNPEYYSWLRSRMKHAQDKYKQGLLPEAVYNQLRDRFNSMQDEAIQLFGETALLSALETLEFQSYEPPSVQTVLTVKSLSVSATPLTFYSGPWSTRATLPDPSAPPTLTTGIPVQTRSGKGIITAIHPADEYFPGGWMEILMADGSNAQTDARYITDAYNRRFVPMTYTQQELNIMELVKNEKHQDASDILPDLNYPADGKWKFSENVDLLDYLKVWEIKDAAMSSGWSYADLFQNRGEYPMPCGQDYGLVCFVHGRNIGDITADDIELISKKNDHGRSLKFQRPRRKEIQDGTTAQKVS